MKESSFIILYHPLQHMGLCVFLYLGEFGVEHYFPYKIHYTISLVLFSFAFSSVFGRARVNICNWWKTCIAPQIWPLSSSSRWLTGRKRMFLEASFSLHMDAKRSTKICKAQHNLLRNPIWLKKSSYIYITRSPIYLQRNKIQGSLTSSWPSREGFKPELALIPCYKIERDKRAIYCTQ